MQFAAAERADATVVFTGPVRGRARCTKSRGCPASSQAEPFRSVPVRLRAGHRSYRTAITGLPPEGEAAQLLDTELTRDPVPADGLLLSRRLGERLHVGRLAIRVAVEVLEGAIGRCGACQWRDWSTT